MSEALDVVIFTCEGREHLLQKTWQSFAPQVEAISHRRILAIDGQVSPEAVKCIQPDLVVQNYRRRGYVQSMLNAIGVVDSRLFFWLEDDWQITGEFDLERALVVLKDNPPWVQVRWSKTPLLKEGDYPLIPGIHFSSVGFSANPCLCRTELVRQGLNYLVQVPRGDTPANGFFENILTKWARSHNLICGVFDPHGRTAVTHLGFLESTGREWLMTASLDGEPAQHFFRMAAKSPEAWRRLWMAIKFCGACVLLLLRIPFSDSAYELAFRMIATVKVQLGSHSIG